MTISVEPSRLDTYAFEAAPATNYGALTSLYLANLSSNRRWSYLFFPRPFPIGAQIVSAKLHVWLKGTGWASGGSHTVTAQRLSSTWRETGPGSLTWNNKPTVGATAPTVVVANSPDLTRIEIDVTALMAEVAAGLPYFGIRLLVSTNAAKALYSSEATAVDARPELVVEWSTPPGPPSDLAPSGARSVSIAKPTLVWTFNDTAGEAQTQFQVQISANSDMSSPEYDSGWIADEASRLDLSTTAYAGVTSGATRYWRVRVQDPYGQISDWSDIAEFARTTKGTLAFTNPTSTPVDDTSPVVTWTLTGRTQQSVEIFLDQLQTSGSWANIFDSGIAASTDLSYTLPEGLIIDATTSYRIRLRIWDTIERQDTPGDPSYVEATSITFLFARTAIAAVTTLTIAAVVGPEVTLQFARTNRPDFFAIREDGQYIEQRIDPIDVEDSPGSTTYTFKHWKAKPQIQHTYEVEAVVNSAGHYQNSSGNATATYTPPAKNCWLVDPITELKVCIIDPTEPDFDIGEDGATFNPVGSQMPVRITGTIRGFEGSVSGALADYKTLTAAQWRDAYLALKAIAPRTKFRLVWRDQNVEVIVGEFSGPRPLREGWYEVGFPFWQVGDFAIANPV